MKKVIFTVALIAAMTSAKAHADCVCYGTEWENGFEYATVECLVTDDPCYHTGDEDLNDRDWELVPYGEWPAGLVEQACESVPCDHCGFPVYQCGDIFSRMRRRYVGPMDGC